MGLSLAPTPLCWMCPGLPELLSALPAWVRAGRAPGGSADARHCQGRVLTRPELCHQSRISGLEVLDWLL